MMCPKGVKQLVPIFGTVLMCAICMAVFTYMNAPLSQHSTAAMVLSRKQSILIPPPLKSNDKELIINSSSNSIQPDLSLTNGYGVTLTIHMASTPRLVSRFFCIGFQSAALFWPPKLGKIGLILDEESQRDHEFAAKIKASEQEQNMGFIFDIKYQPKPADPNFFKKIKVRDAGYMRQIWNSFWMDKYVDTPIIAWTDTDALFTTPVTPENILNGDKLRIFGLPAIAPRRVQYEPNIIATGKTMFGGFACFPLYIWRDTVTNCRNYIMKHLNVDSFEEAFLKFGSKILSCPIAIIYTYAFYFERDRYDWHLEPAFDVSLEEHNKKQFDPGFGIRPNETFPEVCAIFHNPAAHREVSVMQGYCVALRYIGKIPDYCKKYKDTQDFLLFETGAIYHYKGIPVAPWCRGEKQYAACLKVIETHYQNVAKSYKNGLYDFDFKRVRAVEETAKKFGITCPKLGGLNY